MYFDEISTMHGLIRDMHEPKFSTFELFWGIFAMFCPFCHVFFVRLIIMDMLCAKICIIDINIYNMQMGFCRKVKKWFDGLDFGFSHLHDYLGLHDYPGLKSTTIWFCSQIAN